MELKRVGVLAVMSATQHKAAALARATAAHARRKKGGKNKKTTRGGADADADADDKEDDDDGGDDALEAATKDLENSLDGCVGACCSCRWWRSFSSGCVCRCSPCTHRNLHPRFFGGVGTVYTAGAAGAIGVGDGAGAGGGMRKVGTPLSREYQPVRNPPTAASPPPPHLRPP